ncbi:MAG: sulfatase, partial [Bacteroidetes bacterium]|nr:sulfatase [Bacteroidota bacterium]
TVFTGYIEAPKEGEYTFYVSCDGRAFLRIHNIQVLDADYSYPGNLPRTESIFLKAGLHPFSFSYYRNEDRGDPFIKLDWSGPGMPRKKMQGATFFRDATGLQ